MSAAIGSFILGVVCWFALLCAIGLAFELLREQALERRRTMRRRIARHVTRR